MSLTEMIGVVISLLVSLRVGAVSSIAVPAWPAHRPFGCTSVPRMRYGGCRTGRIRDASGTGTLER
ncbi:hypothetical protein GCM10009807_05920 [Microbacterium lacus]|uniref:Uncharacterized protein n=1 Tax=Microbacterium lacus TaxID=415217 RepID=A0ABN2G347_9MICO